MTKFPGAVAVLWLAATGAVAAPPDESAPKARAPGGLAGLDQDADGRITKAEADRHEDVRRQFPALDMNRDGALSAAEFARFEVKPSADE